MRTLPKVRTSSWVLIAAGALALVGFSACSKQEDDETQAAKLLNTSVTPEARTEAGEIFQNRCTPCHGPMGAGDGTASANLSPKPRNFQDKDWQKSVTNEHITKIVRYGGASVGKSPAMPANPDLNDKPAVVAALTGRVRGFGR